MVFIGEDTPGGMLNFNRIIEMGKEVSDEELAAVEAALNCHETINMQYTSGTTGFPKGVMLTHFNLINNGFNIGECMKLTERDRLCIPVPFFHCFGCVLGVMACVTHGTRPLKKKNVPPSTASPPCLSLNWSTRSSRNSTLPRYAPASWQVPTVQLR